MADQQVDPLDLAMMDTGPSPKPIQQSNAPVAPAKTTSAPEVDSLDTAMMDTGVPTQNQTAAPVSKPKTTSKFRDLSYADKVAYRESGNKADAKNPNSSATGTGQFIDSTWLDLVKRNNPELAQGKSDAEILALRNDPSISRSMIEILGNENGKKLQAAGIPVNDSSKYGSHWFGADGFINLYNSDPNTPVEKVLSPQVVAANHLQGKTVDQLKTIIAQKMGYEYLPENLDIGQAMSMAKDNLIPSTKRLAAGVASSVIHLGDTASALWGIGRAAASKIDGAAGRPQNEDEKAKIEAPLDALFESYKDKYRDMPSFLSYLAHDPAGVLADLSLIAGGGEIAAAKAGQMVGKAGELATRVGAETAGSALSATGSAVSGVGKAVGKVGTAINPLNPLGVLTPESSLISTSGRRAIGASGELTPKVDSMIQKVSDGVLSAADFRDPFARSQLVDVIRKKGLTPEAVKEGILRSQGLQTPSSVITGRAAPSAAYEANNLAIASNADALAGRARGIAGAEIMGPDIGAHLESAGVNSYNNAVDKYAAIRSTPGRFLPGSLGGTSWQSHLESELGRSGLPSNRELLEANGLENAAQAHDLINGVLNNGQRLVRTGGPLDAQEVLRLRQRLNDLAGKASGSDVKAVRDISTAFDNHLADAAEKGYFIDPANNQVNRNIAQNIRDASDAYKKHMNTFEVRNGANNNVVNAYKQLKSGFERDPEGRLLASNDSSLHQAAQATLERDLLNPSKGAITHSNLTNAMGGTGSLGEEAVNNYVRNAVMNSENNVLRPPKHIKQLLTDPNSVVHRAFLPEELSEVRKIHAAHNINSTRPTLRSQGESMLRGTIAPLAARAIAAPIGYHLAGFPGAIAGAAIEKGAESLLAKGAIKKALSGAPEKTGLVRKASKVVGKLTKPSSIAIARAIKEENDRKAEIARSQKLKEAAASGGRIERAAGGRASNHEALVARLMRMADQAKKATDKTTEPLLDAPDEAIVKALGVAQQAI